MKQPQDEKINLNKKEDVLMLFREIRNENPLLDELKILEVIANITGWEVPPTSKLEGKKIVMRILKISQ